MLPSLRDIVQSEGPSSISFCSSFSGDVCLQPHDGGPPWPYVSHLLQQQKSNRTDTWANLMLFRGNLGLTLRAVNLALLNILTGRTCTRGSYEAVSSAMRARKQDFSSWRKKSVYRKEQRWYSIAPERERGKPDSWWLWSSEPQPLMRLSQSFRFRIYPWVCNFIEWI